MCYALKALGRAPLGDGPRWTVGSRCLWRMAILPGRVEARGLRQGLTWGRPLGRGLLE